MNELLILGIGNPFRGDDGAGWAVIDALQIKTHGKVMLQKSRGDVADLIEAFQNHKKVIVIDACRSSRPSGTWSRIDALHEPLPMEATKTSTHGITISQAIVLAKALGHLPEELILYALEGSCFDVTGLLSEQVHSAIQEVAQHIFNAKETQLCMNKGLSISSQKRS
ncbi:MAG: hydrogenase maturation protease [Chlamydiae bacterium]|nr:hydrogenase maturation protease [Chlamydiota bacterium]